MHLSKTRRPKHSQRIAKIKEGRKRLTWEQTALRLAFDIAKYRSQDPYVQVGAAAIKFDGGINLGYNGAPSGVSIDWSNRETRRPRVLHAEANVLNFVLPGEVKFLAVTHLPCPDCIKTIAQKQIKSVLYCHEMPTYNNALTKQLAAEFNIQLTQLSNKYVF